MRTIDKTLSPQEYRERLTRWSASLAAGSPEALLEHLAEGSAADGIACYIENAVGERYRMLIEETRLLALAFEEFDSLVRRYLQEVPRATFDPDSRELARFLDWLEARIQLTPKQSDFLNYQRAECECLVLAARRRKEFVDFHRRRLSAEQSGPANVADRQTIQVNPIRVWSHLSGIALGEQTEERQDVLFFALPNEIRMWTTAAPQLRLVRALEGIAPCTFSAWQQISGAELAELRTLARQLCEQGIGFLV